MLTVSRKIELLGFELNQAIEEGRDVEKHREKLALVGHTLNQIA